MEMLIMRNTTIFFVCHNVTAIPRIGDTITSGDVKVKVKDVIWHIDDTTWVEIQV